MTSLAKPAGKTSSKSKTKKKSTAKGRGAFRKKTFLKALPESVEHIEIVQQVAGVLEELQQRVLDVKAEASKELKKLMKIYENNYKGIEKRVHQVTSEAKKQAQTSMMQLLQKWHEHKDKLPTPVAREIEKILAQIGTKMAGGSAKKSVRKTSVQGKKTTTKKTTSPKKNPEKKMSIVSPPKNDGEERVHKL